MLNHDSSAFLSMAKQPLAYEHEVDAAIFLGALGREPTENERLATAYYLQHRTVQLAGNVALTGTQVAEQTEEMIENVQNAGFVRSLASDYRAATEPQGSLAEIWKFYKPDISKQPKIGKVLKRAAIAYPIAFLIDFEGAKLLSESSPQRIIGTIGGALLAGYMTARRQKHCETHHEASLADLPTPLSSS